MCTEFSPTRLSHLQTSRGMGATRSGRGRLCTLSSAFCTSYRRSPSLARFSFVSRAISDVCCYWHHFHSVSDSKPRFLSSQPSSRSRLSSSLVLLLRSSSSSSSSSHSSLSVSHSRPSFLRFRFLLLPLTRQKQARRLLLLLRLSERQQLLPRNLPRRRRLHPLLLLFSSSLFPCFSLSSVCVTAFFFVVCLFGCEKNCT